MRKSDIFPRIIARKGENMIKVKTFTNQLQIFHIMQELDKLDEEVNQFLSENGITNVISVSDTSTVGEGNTIGIIRVVTYETEA